MYLPTAAFSDQEKTDQFQFNSRDRQKRGVQVFHHPVYPTPILFLPLI